jgi:hypothetical protein
MAASTAVSPFPQFTVILSARTPSRIPCPVAVLAGMIRSDFAWRGAIRSGADGSVFAARMISEMAAYYKNKGMTIADRLDEIYAAYGYAKSSLYSYEFKGAAGNVKMQDVMKKLRCGISEIAGVQVAEFKDYSLGIDGLPKSNVLKYYLKIGVFLWLWGVYHGLLYLLLLDIG